METIWSEKADKILNIGTFLSPYGIRNWALTRSQALIVVEELLSERIAILGGDVCTNENNRIFPNGDGWYSDPLPNESMEDFLKRSIDKTRTYIENYPQREDVRLFFNIVPATRGMTNQGDRFYGSK